MMSTSLRVSLPSTASRPGASRPRCVSVRASLERERRGMARRMREAVGGVGEEKMSPGKRWLLEQPGIIPPMGFFDPLQLTSPSTFTVGEAKRFREAELTHGRVAMLAAVGWLVQERFAPLFGGNIGGPAIHHFQEVNVRFPSFWLVILFSIALFEGVRISNAWNSYRTGATEQIQADYEPGTALNFDPLGLLKNKSEDDIFDLKSKELNNGRLAMIAVAGFAAQEEVSHKTIWKEAYDRGWWRSAIPGVTDRAADVLEKASHAGGGLMDKATHAGGGLAEKASELMPNF